MSEKVLYGIKNVYVAKRTTAESGAVTFGVPVHLAGASEIALGTVGDPVKVYADNITYVKFHVNQGYDGTLSVYNVPDWFSRDYLGMIVDNNGVLVESATAEQADFALIFEFDTETKKTKRTVLYNVTAGRTEINGKTKEEGVSPEAMSIPITATPSDDSGYVKASVVGDLSDAAWASWLNSVYIPSASTQYPVTVTVTSSGAPVANAVVVVGDRIARTSASGAVSFMAPAGTYDVLVSATGKTAKTDTVTVSTAAVSKTVTMV